jgi:hypothetical protein
MTDNKTYIGIDPSSKPGNIGLCLYMDGEYHFSSPDDWQAVAEVISYGDVVGFERAFGGNTAYVWENGNFYGRIAQSARNDDVIVQDISSASWKSVVRKMLNIPKEDMKKKKYIPYIRTHLNQPELSEHCCDAWGIVQWLIANDNKESE